MIGAASRVRYSVSIVALTAANALAAFDESVTEAKHMQKRLPSLLEEMEGLKVTYSNRFFQAAKHTISTTVVTFSTSLEV